MLKWLNKLASHRIFEGRGQYCWRCVLHRSHEYYRGQASWVCRRSCCRGRPETTIAAPPLKMALSWWDEDEWEPEEVKWPEGM